MNRNDAFDFFTPLVLLLSRAWDLLCALRDAGTAAPRLRAHLDRLESLRRLIADLALYPSDDAEIDDPFDPEDLPPDLDRIAAFADATGDAHLKEAVALFRPEPLRLIDLPPHLADYAAFIDDAALQLTDLFDVWCADPAAVPLRVLDDAIDFTDQLVSIRRTLWFVRTGELDPASVAFAPTPTLDALNPSTAPDLPAADHSSDPLSLCASASPEKIDVHDFSNTTSTPLVDSCTDSTPASQTPNADAPRASAPFAAQASALIVDSPLRSRSERGAPWRRKDEVRASPHSAARPPPPPRPTTAPFPRGGLPPPEKKVGRGAWGDNPSGFPPAIILRPSG